MFVSNYVPSATRRYDIRFLVPTSVTEQLPAVEEEGVDIVVAPGGEASTLQVCCCHQYVNEKLL